MIIFKFSSFGTANKQKLQSKLSWNVLKVPAQQKLNKIPVGRKS